MKIRNLILVLAAAAALAAQTSDADVMLQRAIRKERVEGDLTGAIDLYKKVIAGAAKNRGAAAKALLGLGECYEKQGNTEAQRAYERLVREFSDQAEPAREAQSRLVALGQTTRGGKPVMAQLIAKGPELDIEGRVTPDGKLYTFVDQDTGNVAVRDLQTGAVRRLTKEGTGTATGDAHAHFPLPSRDGTQIAYCWYLLSPPREDRMEVRLIGMDGSGMRRVPLNVANGASYELVDWLPDGKRVLVHGDTRDAATESWSGYATIDVRTGEEHRISKGTHGHGPARLSSDGRWLIYSRPETAVDSWDIYVLDTETGEERVIVTGPAADRYPVWVPDSDRFVFRSNRNGKDGIWTVRLRDGQTVGDATLIKADAGDFTPIGASRNGSVYYVLSQKSSDIYGATVDPQTLRVQRSPARMVETYLGRNMLPSWSPSGESFAYYSEREFDNGSRMIVRHADGKEVAAALPVGVLRVPPHWCSSGDLLYSWGVVPQRRIRLFDARTGEARFDQRTDPPRFSEWNMLPDCQSLYVSSYQQDTKRRRIFRHEIATGKQTEVSEDGGTQAVGLVVSPDGRSLALYGALEGSDKSGILLLPTAGGRLRMLDDSHGLSAYRYCWTPDSKRLMYSRTVRRPDGQGVENEICWVSLEGGAPQSMGIRMRGASAPSLNPDGKRLLFSATESSKELWVLRNVPLN